MYCHISSASVMLSSLRPLRARVFDQTILCIYPGSVLKYLMAKRKQTPQSSTLHDFFSKPGSSSASKKPRLNSEHLGKSRLASTNVPTLIFLEFASPRIASCQALLNGTRAGEGTTLMPDALQGNLHLTRSTFSRSILALYTI